MDQDPTNDAGQRRAPKYQPLKFLQIFNVGRPASRSYFGLTLLSWLVYILLIVGTISFWLSLVATVKTLVAWQNFGRLLGSLICFGTRRCGYQAVLGSLFPVEESIFGYNLMCSIDSPKQVPLTILDQPLRVANPIAWGIITVAMYALNNALYSIYSALTYYRGIRAVAYP